MLTALIGQLTWNAIYTKSLGAVKIQLRNNDAIITADDQVVTLQRATQREHGNRRV